MSQASICFFFLAMQLNEAVGLESLYYTFGYHICCIVLLFDKGKKYTKWLKFTYKRWHIKHPDQNSRQHCPSLDQNSWIKLLIILGASTQITTLPSFIYTFCILTYTHCRGISLFSSQPHPIPPPPPPPKEENGNKMMTCTLCKSLLVSE